MTTHHVVSYGFIVVAIGATITGVGILMVLWGMVIGRGA